MHTRKGSLLIDALLAVTIFGAVIAAFSSGIMQGQLGAIAGSERIRALYLAEEGIQAVRFVRDTGTGAGFATLNALKGDTTLGVSFTVGNWTMQNDATVVDDIFMRTIRLTEVPGEEDELLAESIVTWQGTNKVQNTVTLTTLLSDWQTAPELVADWTEPVKIATVLKSNDIFEKIAVAGDRAYIVGSRKEQPGFYVYDISEELITGPLGPQLLWSVDINNTAKKAFDIVINGNYAYIATDKSNDEVQIFDLTAAPPILVSSISMAGESAGNSLAVYNDILFVGKQANNGPNPEFFAYSIQGENATNPVLLGTYNDDDDFGVPISVNGISIAPGSPTYAFVACEDTGATNIIEVFALDISTLPASEPPPTPIEIPLAGTRDISTGTKNNAVVVSPSVPTDVFLGHAYGTYGLYSMHVSPVSNPLPDTGGANGEELDFGGTAPYKAVYDLAMSTDGDGFVATDRQTGSLPPPNLRQHPFIAMDFSNATIMGLPQIRYRGNPADNDHILNADMVTNEGGKGIVFRESDNTVFLVTSSPFATPPTSHFAIIRPQYTY